MIHACVKKTWNWFLILYRVSLFSLFLSHRHVRKQELNGPGICVIVSLCQLYFNLAYATLKCAKCVNRMKQLNSVQHQLQRDKPCAFILRLHAFLKSFAAPFCMSLLMFFLLWVDVHNLNKLRLRSYSTEQTVKLIHFTIKAPQANCLMSITSDCIDAETLISVSFELLLINKQQKSRKWSCKVWASCCIIPLLAPHVPFIWWEAMS